jgi:restriction endonuclease S subunit
VSPDLPPGWTGATLGAVTSVCRRGRAPAYDGGETPILNQKCVRSALALDLEFVKLTNETAKPIPDWALLRRGDIVVNSTGTGTLGRVGFVGEDPGRLTADSHVAIIRATNGVVPQFLAFCLHARERELIQLGGGSTNQQELRPDDLKEIRIAFPSVEEQHRIVAIVNEQFRELASAEDELDAIRRTFDHVRAAVLADVNTGASPRRKVGELGEVFVGSTPSRRDPSLWGGDVAWVSSGEVAFRRISRTRETITAKGLGNPDRRLHPPGTVLLAMIGEGKTRGQAAILDVAASHNQNSAAIRLDPRLMWPEFLFYCFMQQYNVNRSFGRGGQQPALNKALVQALEVPCPPLAEQRRLVDEIAESLSSIESTERDVEDAVVLARSFRIALLRDAIGGHLETPTLVVREVVTR